MNEITPLTTTDADAAVALWTAAGLVRPWNDPRADFLRAIDNAAVLGLKRDGTLAATVMVGDDGHRGWVYYLAVAESERGRGLGRAMMRAAEDWLAKRGVPRLNLMVRADNSAVRAFYAALGYRTSDVAVLQKDLP